MLYKKSLFVIYLFLLGTLITACFFSDNNKPPTATVTLTSSFTMTTTIYYVDSTHGSDTYPGTEDQPFQTVQQAAIMMNAGDTAIVQAGNYAERVQVNESGNPKAPITFKTEGKVIINGFTVNADYITIDGFEITNTPNVDQDGIGIFVQGSYCNIVNNYIYYATRGGILLFANPGNHSETSHCNIQNNRLFRNSQYGIDVRGSNNLVEGNEIWGTIQYHPNWNKPPSWVDADGIRFFGQNHIIRNNSIHDINFDDPNNQMWQILSISPPHIDCFQTFADATHEAAQNTIIEQNNCAILAGVDSIDGGSTGFTIQNSLGGILIRNNIISAYTNVFLSDSIGISIINNTLTSDSTLNPEFQSVGISINFSNNIIIKNNIFYNQPGHIIYVKNSSFSSEKNLVYRSDGLPIYTTDTYNPFSDLWNMDPRFVNPNIGNYHLKADSPAIDAGKQNNEVLNDYEGNTRPHGLGIDIGAFESPTP